MKLWQPSAFQQAIEHFSRHSRGRTFPGELSVFDVYQDRRAISRELSRLVIRGRYRFSPAVRAMRRVDAKDRFIFQSTVLDSVVERVLAQNLTSELAPFWPDSLFSYRKGWSPHMAIRAFAAYVRAHSRSRADPKTRGLWVLRRDIANYGPSIPLGDEFWRRFKGHLARAGADALSYSLLREFLPRSFTESKIGAREAASQSDDQDLQILNEGTPTGSPIQPLLNNFYLLSLDSAMESQGGFYARFGDDFIYATEDLRTCQRVSRKVAEVVAGLGLAFSQSKCVDLYFNGSGHASSESSFVSRTRVDLLGASVSFKGGIRLRADKMRRLQRSLARRLLITTQSFKKLAPEALVALLGDTVRTALTPSHPLALPEAAQVDLSLTDRSQLVEFDRWLQRTSVELALGQGIRGFRQLPPSALIALGLPSLVARRNSGCWLSSRTRS